MARTVRLVTRKQQGLLGSEGRNRATKKLSCHPVRRLFPFPAAIVSASRNHLNASRADLVPLSYRFYNIIPVCMSEAGCKLHGRLKHMGPF